MWRISRRAARISSRPTLPSLATRGFTLSDSDRLYLIDNDGTDPITAVRREWFDAGELVRETASLIAPLAEEKGLRFNVDTDGAAVALRTDEGKVRQILINLLSNAIKYTVEGPVAFELRTAGSTALCAVVDTGPGIAREHLENVFEPFWQVDRGDGRRITGTGLGLAVARRLARLLGGDVTLRSRVGEGSTFTLELPLDSPEPGSGVA